MIKWINVERKIREFQVEMQEGKNGVSLLVCIRLEVENGEVEEALELGLDENEVVVFLSEVVQISWELWNCRTYVV